MHQLILEWPKRLTVDDLCAFLKSISEEDLAKVARNGVGIPADPIVWIFEVTETLRQKENPRYSDKNGLYTSRPLSLVNVGDIMIASSDIFDDLDWSKPTGHLTGKDILIFLETLKGGTREVMNFSGNYSYNSYACVRQIHVRNDKSKMPKDCKVGEHPDPDWMDQIFWTCYTNADPPFEPGQLLFEPDIGCP